MTRDEESLDQALLQDILDSRERRAKTAETPKNPEIHFGLDIAERLNILDVFGGSSVCIFIHVGCIFVPR